MPSRKLTTHCPGCGCKNHLRAAFCNQCGARQKEERTIKDEEGRSKLYADIAHPINSACREMIQQRVVRDFHQELERAKLPGYVSKYDDFDHEDAPPPRTLQPAASAPGVSAQPPRVQQPEPPRGPHRLPVHQKVPQTAHVRQDSFGAGIL
jgi:stage V sporulation protein G